MLCHDSNFTCSNQIEFRSKLQSLALKYYHNFNPYKIFSVIFSRSDLNLLKKIFPQIKILSFANLIKEGLWLSWTGKPIPIALCQ